MDAGQASMCAALCNDLVNPVGKGVAICAFSRVCRLAIRSQRLTLEVLHAGLCTWGSR